MSDIMLIGVLCMPAEMALHGTLSRYQLHSRAQEAAARLERIVDQPEIATLRATLTLPLDEVMANDASRAKFVSACNQAGHLIRCTPELSE